MPIGQSVMTGKIETIDIHSRILDAFVQAFAQKDQHETRVNDIVANQNFQGLIDTLSRYAWIRP